MGRGGGADTSDASGGASGIGASGVAAPKTKCNCTQPCAVRAHFGSKKSTDYKNCNDSSDCSDHNSCLVGSTNTMVVLVLLVVLILVLVLLPGSIVLLVVLVPIMVAQHQAGFSGARHVLSYSYDI